MTSVATATGLALAPAPPGTVPVRTQNDPVPRTPIPVPELELDPEGPRGWPSRALLVDLAFAAVVVGVALLRFWPLWSRGAPTGNDWANMLMIGHAYLGHTIDGTGISYPPLVPLLVVGAAAVVPLTMATAVLAAIGSVLPAVGGYVALRPLKRPVRVALAMCLVLLASSSAEQSSWGGLPELIAFGCLPPMLVAAALVMEGPTVVRAIGFGVSLFLLAASSHIVLFEAIVCVVALVLVQLCSGRTGIKRLLRSSPWLLIPAAPTALLTPIYLHLLSGFELGQAASHSETLSLSGKFAYLFREGTVLWGVCIAILALLPIATYAYRGTREAPYLKAGTALALASGCIAVVVPNVRFFYLLPLATAVGIALLLAVLPLDESLPAATIATVAVILLLAVNLILEGQRSFELYPGQVAYYGSLAQSPSTMAGITWIERHTAPQSVIAVTSVATDGSPFGWWVEGLAQHRALVESDPQLLYLSSQLRNDRLAQGIFASFPSMTSLEKARDAGASYLMVLRTWSDYDPDRTESFVTSHPGLVSFSDEDVLILKVPGR